MMTAPKLLPWFARKAGVSEDVARKIWRRAAGEAELLTGNRNSTEYHALCIDRFLSHLEVESGTDAPLMGSRYAWMWQHQARMANYNLAAARSTCKIWQDFWNKVCSPRAFC